jgi:heme/copper-type cytochrome/quinol oxidase subunit 2
MTSSQSLFAALLLAAMLASPACSPGGRPTPTPTASPTETPSPSPQPSPTPQAKVIQVTVSGGQVSTAERRVEIPLGEMVRIEVTADVTDEVHVHGYERKVPVRPGETAVVEFEADIPGVFEVELEKSRVHLLELRVQ